MMEFLQSNITPIVAFFTLISNIFFVVVIVAVAVNKNIKDKVFEFVNTYVLQILFITTFTAVVGSLAYSNIVGFPPCELCWAQRILMYPQALIFFMAMLKRDTSVIRYLLPLSLIGIVVAFYQSLTHWGFNSGLLDCTAIGGDCAKIYVLEYGYITIPFMSLSIFVYMAVVSWIYLKSNNGK